MNTNHQKQIEQHEHYTDSQEAAVFGALCLFFSAVEYLIPKPLPFLRLGFANIPLIAALFVLSPRAYMQTVLIKIAGQGIISGSLFSYIFLFSAAGTCASALVMFALRPLCTRFISCAGISTAGALASNCVQLLLARFLIFGAGTRFIAFPFLIAGTVTSFLLGIGTALFMEQSVWFKQGAFRHIKSEPASETAQDTELKKNIAWKRILRTLIGFGLLAVLLFSTSIVVSFAVFVLSFFLLVFSGKKVHFVPFLIMSGSILVLSVFAPAGKILCTAGSLRITEGALLGALRKICTIEGMFFLSRWIIAGGFALPGKAGFFVRRTFSLFASLSAAASSIKLTPFSARRLISDIDDVLFTVCGTDEQSDT